MKQCKDCQQTLKLSEFYTYRRADKVTFYARCKVCHRARNKTVIDPVRKAELRRLYRQRAQDYISEVKNVPCADCGVRYPSYVMDLDHVRGEKVSNLSKMVGRNAMKELVAEVAKCEVVCANCHRERTWSKK